MYDDPAFQVFPRLEGHWQNMMRPRFAVESALLGWMKRSIWAGAFACALIVSLPAKATDFTLSEAAILSLDWNNPNSPSPAPTATITSEQDIPGTGVQFTFHFTSTNWQDYVYYQLSDKNHGAGTLTHFDPSGYANFDLKFTLVKVDGSTSASQILEAGTFIGPYNGYSSAYEPEVTSLAGIYPSTVVSHIPITSNTVSEIGFTVNLWPFGGWSAGPHDITILVQPADGAVQIVPEPATWMLAMLGVGVLLGTRRMLRRW